MSLTPCQECATPVSTEAKTCPSCGAKVKRPMRTTTKLLIGAVIALLVSIQMGVDKKQAKLAARTPEQIAADTAKEKALTRRENAANGVARALKDSMRDPDSLKIDSMRVSDDSKTVCVEYRAKNGFGGYNRELVTYLDGKGKKGVDIWNKNCLTPLTDLMYAIK